MAEESQDSNPGGIAGLQITIPFNGWKPRPHQQRCGSTCRTAASARWRSGTDAPARTRSACTTPPGDDDAAGQLLALLAGIRPRPQGDLDCVNPHTGKRRIDEVLPARAARQHQRHTRCSSVSATARPGSASAAIATTPPSAPASAGIVYSEWALSNPQRVGVPPADDRREQRLGVLHHHAARPQPRQDDVRVRACSRRTGSPSC